MATHNAVAPMDRRGNKKGSTAPPEGSRAELELLRALIARHAGSSPSSQVDVESALETGLGRLMSLEGRRREQARRAGGTRPSEGMCEDHDLVDEIRALREAITQLRMRTNAGETALARGFVMPHLTRLGGGGYLPMYGLSLAPGLDGAGMGARQRAGASPAVERHPG